MGQQKKREPIFHRGKYTAEGCATFFKTSRFKRVEKHIIDFDKLAQQHFASNVPSAASDKAVARLSKGNIAVAIILEDLHIKPREGSASAVGPNGGHVLCVINTHILADPEFTDVKLWQAQMLLRTLESMPQDNMPILVCGDFNSTPSSGTYELWRNCSVRSDHDDLHRDPLGLLRNLHAIGHTLRLMSAYETCAGREAEYTNYTEDFKGTLDYIWFTPDTLSVLAISQVDDESQLSQETALPSSTRPSDHISLVCTFMFNDAPTEDRHLRGPVTVSNQFNHDRYVVGPV